MIIRPMRREDVASVAAIYATIDKADAKIIKRVYGRYYASPKRSRTNKDFVAIQDNKIIGFSGFHKEDTETTDIYWMNWTAIHPDSQRSGVGTALMHKVMEEVRKRGGRKLYVGTSSEAKYKQAIAFYKKQGFKEEARFRDYYRDGVDSIYLSKQIATAQRQL